MWQCCESTLEQVLNRDKSCCTYHHPGTGVVSLESKRQPAVGGQHGGVSAGGVVVVEGVDVALLPGLLTGTEDVEVVAVQVWRRKLASTSVWRNRIVRTYEWGGGPGRCKGCLERSG